MPHPKDDQLIPIGTTVIIKSGVSAGKKAVIRDYTFQFNGRGFLNYLGTIEGRKGTFALYHDDLTPLEGGQGGYPEA